jgi:hypothetical protein
MFISVREYSSGYGRANERIVNVHAIQHVSQCRGYSYIKMRDGTGFEAGEPVGMIQQKIAAALLPPAPAEVPQ